MYDTGKVLTGIVIFLGLFTYPIWNRAIGVETTVPTPQIDRSRGQDCVQPGKYMKAFHMDLLNTWRDEAIRGGTRIFQTSEGKKVDMSLTRTCMDCHTSKAQFCDKCHNYLGVDVYCWDCHVAPKEKE